MLTMSVYIAYHEAVHVSYVHQSVPSLPLASTFYKEVICLLGYIFGHHFAFLLVKENHFNLG